MGVFGVLWGGFDGFWLGVGWGLGGGNRVNLGSLGSIWRGFRVSFGVPNINIGALGALGLIWRGFRVSLGSLGSIWGH